MKKIGLLTFHASHNNGSILQCLAFQTILREKYNLNVEVINYSNKEQQEMYSVLPKPISIKRIIKRMILSTNYILLKRQYIHYDNFINKYLLLSGEKIDDYNSFINESNKYDAIIVGSDQIWNIKARDADDLYFLDFQTKIKKLAYAISFGANNPFDSDKREKYVKCLEDFCMISVRENNAKKWISQNTSIMPNICLDPTMLISQQEWEKMVDVSRPIISGKYIFFYCFSIDNKTQKFLRYISKKYSMPVYFLDAKEWTIKFCWKNKIRLLKKYGPDIYLNAVKYAEMFITTSFHGTAFSVIFKKNFWYIDNGDNYKSNDDRAISFLSQLNLMKRYRDIEWLKNNDLFTIIDYDDVYKNLSSLKTTSFDYIEKMVGVINDK